MRATVMLFSMVLWMIPELQFSEIIYRESFDKGPAVEVWTVGKNNPDRKPVVWHRNILGHYGGPFPLDWSEKDGRSGGYAYSESPWYFDDNHGEFMWFHLVFRVKNTEDGGISGIPDAGISGRDLRNARVNLSLRGRDLQLKGTKLFFWVQGLGGRNSEYRKEVYYNWALTSQPLEGALVDGKWHDVSFNLVSDEMKWSQLGLINGGLRKKILVIQSRTAAEGTLDEILGGRHWNWGFLLCGVDPLDQPTGRIDIDEFSIETGLPRQR